MMILQTSRGALSSGGFDRMAARYIKAVETAGAIVTSTQKDALNTFFKAGKSEGWISSLRRMYLPIWGATAPNAIDMIALTSGTFVGTVTHATGYVQGDGSTGYFDFGASPSSLGLTISGGSAFALINQADSRNDARFFIGVQTGGNRRLYLQQVTSTLLRSTIYSATGATINTSATPANGILLTAVNSATDRYLKKRDSSEISTTTISTSSTTSAPTSNVFAMANNDALNLSISGHTNARLGAFGLGLGFTSTQGDNLTLTLKNLWETSTGLTLP
jgi:hypothetical protein